MVHKKILDPSDYYETWDIVKKKTCIESFGKKKKTIFQPYLE